MRFSNPSMLVLPSWTQANLPKSENGGQTQPLDATCKREADCRLGRLTFIHLQCWEGAAICWQFSTSTVYKNPQHCCYWKCVRISLPRLAPVCSTGSAMVWHDISTILKAFIGLLRRQHRPRPSALQCNPCKSSNKKTKNISKSSSILNPKQRRQHLPDSNKAPPQCSAIPDMKDGNNKKHYNIITLQRFT